MRGLTGAMLLFTLSCSGGSDDNTQSAGGSGGAAGALPWRDPNAPPAQGALYVFVEPPDTGGASCSGMLPFSIPSGTEAASAIRRNAGEGDDGTIYRVIDGEDGALVACTVSLSSTDEVTLSGTIEKAQTVSFSVDGTFPGAANGTATIEELDNSRVSRLSGECELAIEFVAPGAIWTHFDCAEFSSSDGTEQCQARGTFVFENCAK